MKRSATIFAVALIICFGFLLTGCGKESPDNKINIHDFTVGWSLDHWQNNPPVQTGTQWERTVSGFVLNLSDTARIVYVRVTLYTDVGRNDLIITHTMPVFANVGHTEFFATLRTPLESPPNQLNIRLLTVIG